MQPRILAVVGPTASGKTALAVQLAERLNGEILSCDSMQIYRGMDIGTAKPTPAEQRGVLHHLLDLVDPDTPFSCADYARIATEATEAVLARGKLPIFCGGTGLYLDSVLYDRPYAEIPEAPGLRAELEALPDRELLEALAKADPAAAAVIHPNNRKRVIRALEVYRLTGIPKSEWDARSAARPPRYRACQIGLDFADRAALYDRIDRRVDAMLAQGLEQEVFHLHLSPHATAAQAIGYKEFFDCFAGRLDRAEAVRLIKQRSRNYAKRQLTWFRRTPSVHWILRQEGEAEAGILARALAFWEESTLAPPAADPPNSTSKEALR